MSVTRHRLSVTEARVVTHPVFTEIKKHYFTIRAKELPPGIRTDANARNPNGLNRRVYREVHESLMGRGALEGTFDLLNKGIICLAKNVRRIDNHTYDIKCGNGEGIADGAHTYKIICDAQNDPEMPDEQFVEFQVRTGVCPDLITDMARGLNSGIQVKPHSLANLDGKYEWLKDELAREPYFDRIAWTESDKGDFDVRELICVLEALNVFDFANNSGRHPIKAYEKISAPTAKFSEDFDLHKANLDGSTYYRLRGLLREALVLYDHIRHDFRDVYNAAALGRAARLDIVDWRKGNRRYDFPFAGLPDSQYRLTKGALYPIFAGFRNKVGVNKITKQAQWIGGFDSVLELWHSVATETTLQTKNAVKNYGRKPDQLGKSRGHWTNMHQTIELHILRKRNQR